MTDTIQSYAGVVFDLDGTLVDSFAAIAASVNHVRANYALPPLTVEEVQQQVGRGAEYLLERTVPKGVLAENLANYRAHHPTVMFELTRFLPGASTLLASLHQRGKKVGLCSNKPRLFSDELLRHFGLAACFDVVLGPEDVPRPKPAPDMLLTAVDRLGLACDHVLYVGDMVVDIQTARAAGVRVWAVASGSEQRQALVEAKPDRLLTDLREMLAEIERM
jgi:phosphoglycolate phosphatase